jgi:phosphopantothenoylcysteine decarboxylase/phosphopantothenate--cysteine ligase
MGYAVAQAGCRRGARVVLISGPTHLDPPAGVEVARVRTAEQMAQAVLHHFEQATVTLMAAAVADFRPVEVYPHKLKKQDGIPQLKLEHTPDILAMLASRRRPGQVVVGFSAETENLLANAAAKVRDKHLDFIVANDVSQPGAGFDVETNIVTLVFPDGRTKPLEKMSKLEVAQRILDEVVAMRKAVGSRQ